MTVYTTLPTDDQNLAITVTDDPDLVVLNITPASVSGVSVTTVNGQSGVVVLDTDDVQEDGSPINKYFTDPRAQTVITANSEGFIKADTTNTLTNKSGNISQWTNDSGYITSASEDDQTLSFSSPDLTITSGNTVDISALTSGLITASSTDTLTNKSGSNSQWTNDENYSTTTNNAANRVITGTGTTNTIDGNSDFTWDGSNAVMDGSAGGLTSPVVNIKTDNSGWNRPQLMVEDSNGKTFSQVGQHNTTYDYYQWNITLDPDNTHGRTGVTTWAGDYFVDFQKNYTDPAAIVMKQRVFGANNGFELEVRDDYNSGGGNQYKRKPFHINTEEVNFNMGPDGATLALTVDDTKIDCKIPIGQATLASDPSSPEDGWTYYNTTTDKLRLYAAGAWVDLN